SLSGDPDCKSATRRICLADGHFARWRQPTYPTSCLEPTSCRDMSLEAMHAACGEPPGTPAHLSWFIDCIPPRPTLTRRSHAIPQSRPTAALSVPRRLLPRQRRDRPCARKSAHREGMGVFVPLRGRVPPSRRHQGDLRERNLQGRDGALLP